MIEARRQQLHFGEGLIAEEVSDLRGEWMKHDVQVLEDEQLVATVNEALAKRSPKSRTRARRGTPAEVVMRLLLLNHIRNWSYEVLEREVWANLVYRDFTRVGTAKAPDCITMGRWGLALGPETVEKIHARQAMANHWDVLNVLVDSASIAYRPDGTARYGSLFTSLADMLWRDLEDGFGFRVCRECENLMRTQNRRAIYCSRQCQWNATQKAHRRRLAREEEKKSKNRKGGSR